MKKAIALLFSGMLISSALFAQVRLGVKGGVNFPNMRFEPRDQTQGTPDVHSRFSLHGGVLLDVEFASQLAIQTGALLSGKGSKVVYDNPFGSFTNKLRPVYIEVPVNLLFKPWITYGMRLYMGGGPYIGFGIGGKTKFYGSDVPIGDLYTNHRLKFGNDSRDDLKKKDIGGNILAGLEFNNGLIIGAQYGLSFTNNAPRGSNSANKILRNKVFSISIGYLFSNYNN